MGLAAQDTNTRVRRQVKGGWLGLLSRTLSRQSNGNTETNKRVAGKVDPPLPYSQNQTRGKCLGELSIDYHEAKVSRTEFHGAVPQKLVPYDPHGFVNTVRDDIAVAFA